MKKALLSFLALALAAGASAQSDPKLTEGTYYIQNVENGKYISSGSSWGTRATFATAGIPFTVKPSPNDTLAEGKYILVSAIDKATNAMRPSDAFVDQSGDWILQATDGGILLYNGSQYLANTGATRPEFTADATSAGTVWQFVSKADMESRLDAATSENPVDATFYITAPDFLAKDTRNSAWQGGTKLGGPTSAGNTLNNCLNTEKWNAGNFDVNQTLSGLRPGIYSLSAQGFYRHGDAGTGAIDAYLDSAEVRSQLYAGDKSVDLKSIFDEAPEAKDGGWTAACAPTEGTTLYIPNSQNDAAACFETGAYLNTLADIEVKIDGTLTIGVKREGDACHDWTCFDTFRLTYYGPAEGDTGLSEEDIIAIMDEAGELAFHPMYWETQKKLSEAYQAFGESLSEDDYKALSTAIVEAKTSVKAYENAMDALEGRQQLAETTNFYTTEALNEYLTKYQDAFDELELTNEEAAALTNPYKMTGWHSDQKVNDFLLPVWTIDDVQCKDFLQGLYINTWSVEGNTDGTNFKCPFFEYWIGDGESLAAKTLTATLQGVEPGAYDITAWVRVRIKNGGGDSAQGITLQGVNVCDGEQAVGQFRLKEVEATANVADDGVLTVQFQVAEDNNVSWLSFQNLRYAKNEIATAIEGVENTATAAPNAIYNLQGQRLVKTQKGLNIVGGKKVIVK